MFATDSQYVVNGATTSARNWVRNGWRAEGGRAVVNRDLWELLLGEAEERWRELGMLIQFWWIPRELNRVADNAAREGVEKDAREEWHDVRIL